MANGKKRQRTLLSECLSESTHSHSTLHSEHLPPIAHKSSAPAQANDKKEGRKRRTNLTDLSLVRGLPHCGL